MFSGISHVYSRTPSGTGESQLPHQIKRRAISNAGSPIARRYLVMEPRLVIMCGAKRGTTVRLSGAELTIGHDSMSGLSIGEESISRKHCAVLSDGDKYRIVDF